MDTITGKKIYTASRIAPEDLRPGHYITITRLMFELLPPMCEWQQQCEVQPVRVWSIPPIAGRPMRIVSVCLPFVLVEGVDRQCRTLDLRRVEISRLPKKYGRAAFERLAPLPTQAGASAGSPQRS